MTPLSSAALFPSSNSMTPAKETKKKAAELMWTVTEVTLNYVSVHLACFSPECVLISWRRCCVVALWLKHTVRRVALSESLNSLLASHQIEETGLFLPVRGKSALSAKAVRCLLWVCERLGLKVWGSYGDTGAGAVYHTVWWLRWSGPLTFFKPLHKWNSSFPCRFHLLISLLTSSAVL